MLAIFGRCAVRKLSSPYSSNRGPRIEGIGSICSIQTHLKSARVPAGLRQVDAGDTDDGLPCGFLVGAIVEVWVALSLDWTGELFRRPGEELP